MFVNKTDTNRAYIQAGVTERSILITVPSKGMKSQIIEMKAKKKNNSITLLFTSIFTF